MLEVVFDARSIVAKRSGIGTYADNLLRHLVPLADDVRFLVLRHPSARSPLVRHERVRELRLPGETKSVHTKFRVGRALRGFEPYDLYHAPAEIVPIGLRCPWVVTVHDLMWIEAPRLASAFLPVRLANGAWYHWNYRHAVAGARAVIAISQATADAIARVYPREAPKTTVIHHGIDHQRFAPGQGGPRSALDGIVPAGCRYSLIVGQGSPYKNHLGMVRAFVEATADRANHKLVLVRRFSRIDRGMNRLLREPAVRDKLIVVPFVPDDLLLALYRHARIVLCASHYEGFGLPALEAMALGAVVLASTTPALAEVTADGALHAVAPDHADLVDKIRRLDDDEALRLKLGEAGPRRAQQFSWERCAAATLEVYRAAAGRR